MLYLIILKYDTCKDPVNTSGGFVEDESLLSHMKDLENRFDLIFHNFRFHHKDTRPIQHVHIISDIVHQMSN